jgi:hypothetical protein
LKVPVCLAFGVLLLLYKSQKSVEGVISASWAVLDVVLELPAKVFGPVEVVISADFGRVSVFSAAALQYSP